MPTHELKVDLNKARLRGIEAYNCLCKKLNEAVKQKDSMSQAEFDPENIEEDMDELRSSLVILGCSFSEDDPDFRNISEEFGELETYNPYGE